jgi:hypothetical protein
VASVATAYGKEEPDQNDQGGVVNLKVDYSQWINSGFWGGLGSSTGNSKSNIQYIYQPTAVTGQYCPETHIIYQYQNVSNLKYEVTNWYQALVGGAYIQSGATAANSIIYSNLGQQAPETAEEKAARVKRFAELEAKRKAASLRAEHLLFTILTPSQVRQYTDDAYVEQEIDGRIYRLHCNSRSGNVILLEDGKPKFKYCAHPIDAHDVPMPDVLLSQLLMLKTDEQAFLKIANRTVLQ